MAAPIVFFDIAGQDAAALRVFYAAVFDWEIGVDGRMSIAVKSPVDGMIRNDPNEKRLYLGVSDINEALEQVTRNGGSIDTPRFEVPGVVVLGLFRDPAGNPMGLVEMENGALKVP